MKLVQCEKCGRFLNADREPHVYRAMFVSGRGWMKMYWHEPCFKGEDYVDKETRSNPSPMDERDGSEQSGDDRGRLVQSSVSELLCYAHSGFDPPDSK